jgi:hypothetical protein
MQEDMTTPRGFAAAFTRSVGMPLSAFLVIHMAWRTAPELRFTFRFALSAVVVIAVGLAATYFAARLVWKLGLWPGSRR